MQQTTDLELAAALYQGKTKCSLGDGYNATSNVKQFVERFFPGSGRKIPLLLWNGIRNGIDYVFSPKAMKCSSTEVKSSFYVKDKRVPSHAIKNQDKIIIKVNSIEFYNVLKQAVADYKRVLQQDCDLQDYFIAAWQSIENNLRDVTGTDTSREVQYLEEEVRKSNRVDIFL